jgi:hypothetical protein
MSLSLLHSLGTVKVSGSGVSFQFPHPCPEDVDDPYQLLVEKALGFTRVLATNNDSKPAAVDQPKFPQLGGTPKARFTWEKPDPSKGNRCVLVGTLRPVERKPLWLLSGILLDYYPTKQIGDKGPAAASPNRSSLVILKATRIKVLGSKILSNDVGDRLFLET